MSAFQDRAQRVSFYYGNAMVDLAHLLPADERSFEAAPTPAQSSENVEALMASLESHLNDLMAHRRDLEFLLKDLKRLLPE